MKKAIVYVFIFLMIFGHERLVAAETVKASEPPIEASSDSIFNSEELVMPAGDLKILPDELYSYERRKSVINPIESVVLGGGFVELRKWPSEKVLSIFSNTGDDQFSLVSIPSEDANDDGAGRIQVLAERRLLFSAIKNKYWQDFITYKTTSLSLKSFQLDFRQANVWYEGSSGRVIESRLGTACHSLDRLKQNTVVFIDLPFYFNLDLSFRPIEQLGQELKFSIIYKGSIVIDYKNLEFTSIEIQAFDENKSLDFIKRHYLLNDQELNSFNQFVSQPLIEGALLNKKESVRELIQGYLEHNNCY